MLWFTTCAKCFTESVGGKLLDLRDLNQKEILTVGISQISTFLLEKMYVRDPRFSI